MGKNEQLWWLIYKSTNLNKWTSWIFMNHTSYDLECLEKMVENIYTINSHTHTHTTTTTHRISNKPQGISFHCLHTQCRHFSWISRHMLYFWMDWLTKSTCKVYEQSTCKAYKQKYYDLDLQIKIHGCFINKIKKKQTHIYLNAHSSNLVLIVISLRSGQFLLLSFQYQYI